MTEFVVSAFYKFAKLIDFQDLKAPFLEFCLSKNINGTILLALEGINGTVAGSRESIDSLMNFLRSDSRLHDIDHKESYTNEPPFDRMKVKLKKEIVPLGVPSVDPNTLVGTYVSPEEWNELISDPEVIIIDTRNDYEFDIGTFKGAIDPNTRRFRDFPSFVNNNLDPEKHQKIAMFCTGGIRCEKASSFMLQQGFKEVFHLKGGILKYLEKIPEDKSLWQGECFVFDQRIAVGNGLIVGNHEQCYACRHPVSAVDRDSHKFRLGVSCPHCFDNLPEKTRARAMERQKQNELAKIRSNNSKGFEQ
ncbi:MAG: hypothetical protein RIR17_592 [Planctomycetota bacterium]|jgi:UPF0176 protein